MLIPAQFGVDIFQELDRISTRRVELLIFDGILFELRKIAAESIKKEKEVNIALELAKKCNNIEINAKDFPEKDVDNIIFHLATQNKWVVATNDRELRKRLRAHQIPVITLRKKAKLSIDGDIPS